MKRIGILILAVILCLVNCMAWAEEYPELQNGSKGEEVKTLQSALIEQGYLTGSADGIFGKGTAAAVQKFQEAEGFEASGVADNATQRRLYGDDELDGIEVNLTGVSETDHMRVDGLFVDDSYVNEGDPNETQLYMFYTVFTAAENYTVSADTITMTVNGVNSYESAHFQGQCDYMGSYEYGKDSLPVNYGTDVGIVETFRLPKAELEAGRTLTFEGDSTIGMSTISLVTDDIVHCRSNMIIAKFMDPEGYKSMSYRMATADADLKKRVKNAINGYYWDNRTPTLTWRIEFSGNEYTLTTVGLGTTDGTYTVLNGFVKVQNASTGAINYLPYTWKSDGDIDLDTVAMFDFTRYQL